MTKAVDLECEVESKCDKRRVRCDVVDCGPGRVLNANWNIMHDSWE
jgi:hypothetical protein